MKKIIYITLSLAIATFLFSSCGNDASLQKYIVEKQNDNEFISLDVPSSLIVTENNTLTAEQLSTVESVKKVNILALQLNQNNKAIYEAEKQRLQSILNNDDYETLMNYGSSDIGAKLMFTGDVEAIDEIIIFASDSERGFGLFRIIGTDMNPTKILKLMESINSNNFDFSFMEDIEKLM